MVTARRGGPTPGETRLTALGRRLLREARTDRAMPMANRWSGIYHAGSDPAVTLGGGRTLHVSFPARERERVEVAIDPGAIVVARHRADLSARNALPIVVRSVLRRGSQEAELRALWNGRIVRVGITPTSVRRLGLAPGARAFLYVKAVAVRRVATRESPRP